MTDIVVELDALAEKARLPFLEVDTEHCNSKRFAQIPAADIDSDGFLPIAHAAFIVALVNAWPGISARLKAAEAVCVAAEKDGARRWCAHTWGAPCIDCLAFDWRRLRESEAGG